MPKRMGLDVFPPRLACTLTPREYEIATLASAALSNKEIAHRLGVTEGTVKAHLHNIYQKADVRNRSNTTLQRLHFSSKGVIRGDGLCRRRRSARMGRQKRGRRSALHPAPAIWHRWR